MRLEAWIVDRPARGEVVARLEPVSGFTRLTTAFLKKVENVAANVALHVMYDSFARGGGDGARVSGGLT